MDYCSTASLRKLCRKKERETDVDKVLTRARQSDRQAKLRKGGEKNLAVCFVFLVSVFMSLPLANVGWKLEVYLGYHQLVGLNCTSFSMYATLDLWLSSLRSLPGEMDETDALRSKRCNEDAISLAPSTTESIIVEGKVT